MIVLDRAVGIDLGTTNSEIALLPPSEREIVVYEDRFGRKAMPSAVAWDPAKEAFVVGRPARARRGKEPGPVESIKRRMGQSSRLALGPHELSPEEISAKILAELRGSMQSYLAARASDGIEMSVSRAVITVPAYFDAPQVEATRRAGELAGLEVIGILQEPTAAAIYHSHKSRLPGGNFLVYDLGGGTFDVSILRCVGGEYQVLAIDGDNFLGGDDFDRRYAEHLRKGLVEKGYALALDVRKSADDRARFERLVHLAQEIKESLSNAEVVQVSKQELFDDQDGESVSFDAEVGRVDYEAVIADLVERTLACAERALAESQAKAGVDLASIDHVVLVGGSTRVPLVRRRVTDVLCARSRAPEPLAEEVDTIVALGSAIHAAQVGGLALETGDGVVRVVFTTPLVSATPAMRLGLRLERAPVGTAELAIVAGGRELAIAAVAGPASEAVRLELVLPGEDDVELVLELRERAGAAIASLPFAVYRGELRPRASALSRASVIAKDIGLEVVRAGRRERRVLLAKGTGLPAEAKHTFYTADQSGTVVLRLLQGRVPIKTLAVQVTRELPVGSPVELALRCDETMRVEASALVAGQQLWASVDAVEAMSFDEDGAVEQLLADAEAGKRALWGNTGDVYRREVDQLSAGIREVVATDPAKLTALCTQLRRLVDDLAGTPDDPMQPPLPHFEAELDALRRVVYRSRGLLVGLDRADWEERISELEQRAHAAHAALDTSSWRRAYNEVQALYETAVQEEFAARRLDDPADLQLRLSAASRYRARLERQLADWVSSSTAELGALQESERARLSARILEHVAPILAKVEAGQTSDLAEARRLVAQASSELERIDSAIERLPSLGLVTERGGGTPTGHA
jgi:molecular chaperone DnaK